MKRIQVVFWAALLAAGWYAAPNRAAAATPWQIAPQNSQQNSQQGSQTAPPSLKTPGGLTPAAGPQQAKPQTPAAAATPKTDPQEDAAYKAFYDLNPTDSDPLIQQGEQFVQKYPQSRYRGLVYSRLTAAYFNKAEFDKMYSAADKALEANPDDYTVMTLVGWVIPHNINPDDPQAGARLALAERYSKRALELLPKISKPQNMPDEEFQHLKSQALAQAHSGLGLTYFRKGQFQDSVAELQQATKLASPPDPTDFFVLGIDQEQLKHYADAAAAYSACAKVPGSLQAHCQENAAAMKKLEASPAAPPAH
jgi:tetratricopeptide (TPR) repeat protein